MLRDPGKADELSYGYRISCDPKLVLKMPTFILSKLFLYILSLFAVQIHHQLLMSADGSEPLLWVCNTKNDGSNLLSPHGTRASHGPMPSHEHLKMLFHFHPFFFQQLSSLLSLSLIEFIFFDPRIFFLPIALRVSLRNQGDRSTSPHDGAMQHC